MCSEAVFFSILICEVYIIEYVGTDTEIESLGISDVCLDWMILDWRGGNGRHFEEEDHW